MLHREDVKIYKVSELVGELNQFFTQSYGKIFVEGEVSQVMKSSTGHTYFTLKDENESVLSCAIFKWNLKIQVNLKVGDKLIVFGKLNVYNKSGKLSMVIENLEKSEGEGIWFKKFQALKEKLSKKGYFDPEHKRELPKVIKNIGIITSPTGAAIKDFLSVLRKRYSDINVILYPSQVQGDAAPQSLIRGIKIFNENYLNKIDAIILTRGGGSIEDLWCFNDEKLADEIYRSELPVISAIGHERDFSISDFVSDIRAATPTAAGELITQDNSEIFAHINMALLRQFQILNKNLFIKQSGLREFKNRFNNFMGKIEGTVQTLDYDIDSLEHSINGNMSRKIEQLSQLKSKIMNLYSPEKVDFYEDRFRKELLSIKKEMNSKITMNKVQTLEHWEKLSIHITNKINMFNQLIGEKLKLLSSLSPLNILKRGYAILLKNGKTIKSYDAVSSGDEIRGILHKGELTLEVKNGKKERKL